MTPRVTLILRIASLAALLGTAHGEEATALPRPEVLQLVDRVIDVYPTDGKLQQELATRPDIKPDLFEMVRIAWQVDKSPDALGTALLGLSLRKDLTKEEIDSLLGPALDYKDPGGLDDLQMTYVLGLIRVLKNYPAPAHEEFVLRYLSSEHKSVKLQVLWTMAEIGTAPSLGELRKFATSVQPPEGSTRLVHDEALKAITAIEKRQAAPEKDPGQAK